MDNSEFPQESHQKVPLGGDYWEADPGVPLWGFADLHAHLMAHLAFGGNAFWGLPYDPEHPGADGMQYALPSCEPIHGGLINANPEFGHPAGGGWPEFIVWPRFTTMVHQQAYIDWLYRAYQGGLRLVSCLAVNNELLATKSNPRLLTDDRNAIATQIAAMKTMAEFIDKQDNGGARGWLQIAYSAEDATRIISQNKLAVVLGVEVDSLGNWRKVEDLEAACQGDPQLARQLISAEMDWLYSLGVRQVTPIHLTNNAFGGTAIYMRFLETVNVFITGEHWEVEDSWQTGVRYRLDQDNELVDDAKRILVTSGGRKRAANRHTIIDHIPGVRTLVEAFNPPDIRGGHANVRSLNKYGVILLEEMMKRGMIIDIDHMSEKSTDATLDMAEAYDYPVNTTHSWFRDLLYSSDSEFDQEKSPGYETSSVHKVAHEAAKRGDQVERIARLGGMVSAILNQGDIAGLRQVMPEVAKKIRSRCAGSSADWAEAYLYLVNKTNGKGVAIGSDINGAACLPGPRFGSMAAFGARNDSFREPNRREEIDSQTNGVAYFEPMRDYRWHRFEPSGESGYDEQACDIWHAIAQFAAGFNPAIQDHPKSDFPELNIQQLLEAADLYLDQGWIDHITLGLWKAEEEELLSAEEISDWPREQIAAYYARVGLMEENPRIDEKTQGLMEKIKTCWEKWQEMDGDNRPLRRSFAGERRDFDINIDGMAHYGMLPDLLQDVRNNGLTAADLAPLFRGAYDYVQMWEKCEARARQINDK